MHEWLTVELLLGTLLVTTFTCVGLLALWAATSPRHWFTRTAIPLAVLAPLLIIPAHEVFAVFAIQSAIIAIGVMAYRRSIPRPRFSLSASLLMMALLAIGTPIAVRMPELNEYAWTTVALNGIASGLSTLLGVWLLVGRRKWIVWPVGILCCISIGAALSMLDWFIPSVANWTGWPPDPNPASILPTFGNAQRPIVAWFVIPTFVATSVAFLSAIWCATMGRYASNGEIGQRAPWNASRVLRLISLACAVAVFAAMPFYVLYRLLTPDPIPDTTLPNPNGHDDFVAAGTMAASTQFDGLNFHYDTALQKPLAAEVAKCKSVFDRVALGLSHETRVPVDYSFSQGSLPYPDIQNFRAVARAIAGKARLAEMEGRFGDSAQYCLDGVTFGQAVARGGLLIDALVGNACAGISMYRLYHERDRLPARDLDRCVARLQEFDAAIEPYNDVWYRDRVWSQRTNGWHGHLLQLLDDIVKQTWDFIFIRSDQYPAAYESHRVTLRLLILEFALRRFHDEQGRWPASVEELTPNYISAVPIDAFDPKRLPLKYRKTETGYIAYSVGANRIDDGGAPPNEDDVSFQETGDFRLDIRFKPDEDTSGSPPNATSQSNLPPADADITPGK